MSGMTWPLRASTLLAAIGLGIGGYLIYVHYNIDALVCGTGECEIVQTSEYSEVMGIPIAIFGTAMYAALLALAVYRLRAPGSMLPASMAALAITGAGTLYSAWLTYLELYVIEAICQWCVASAIVTTLLFAIEIMIFTRLWSSEDDLAADL